jgi:Acetyl-CoA hydrolase/transferase C-terminal domain
LLEAGDGVGIARSDVHYVITEYGIAYLFGQSIRVEILSRNTSMLRLAARAQGTMTTSRDEDVMQVTVLFPDSARKPPAEPAYDDRAPAQIP